VCDLIPEPCRKIKAKKVESRTTIRRVKHWEIIADNLSKAGWSWGWVSALDGEWRAIWIVDAHRGKRRRFTVIVLTVGRLYGANPFRHRRGFAQETVSDLA
jgi:hypothetical protein